MNQLKDELRLYSLVKANVGGQNAFGTQDFESQYSVGNQANSVNVQKLVARIEELEDLVEELRTQNSPKECMDLRSLVESQGMANH